MTEWISVKDRLPPENKRVLVYDPSYDNPIFISECMIEAFRKCFKVNWHYQPWQGKDNVTHWAELPKPPEDK